MKRFFALLLALAMVLSLGVTAFATETEPAGSITITNATKDDVYKLYKIFDATYDEKASDADNDGIKDNVSYTLAKTVKENGTDVLNPIYQYMFTGEGITVDEENDIISNAYFTYAVGTGQVKRISGTDNKDVFKYLSDMIRALEKKMADEGKHLYLDMKTANDKTVAFTGLNYGYYLIDKAANKDGTDVAVTITSNTPAINVIDKNQKPATEFSKLIWDEDFEYEDEDGNIVKGKWVTDSSANIGDIVDFKVEFDATNYDGEEQIQYYTILDTKGNALWVEFNGITVEVDGVPLNKGYYHGTVGQHSEKQEWTYLGTGWDEDADGNPTGDIDNAQWYLVHYGFDKFEIVIPWMSNHDFTGNANGFTLTYGEGATSIYGSPANVVVKYSASVEPSADIGNPESNNLWNKAELSWNGTSRPGSSTTHTKVYALGLHKVDADNNKISMKGVEFEIYRDKECKEPVYVIPTDVKGVYILDDLKTFVSGENRETSRQKYAAYLEAYLGEDYATTQKNVLTTEANGKFAVLGLEAGTYYLKETKTLDGYNLLDKPKEVVVGDTTSTFFVILDENKNVVDSNMVSEGQTKKEYTATSVTVENSKGVQLPSTGGMGTMMLITFGTMIAIAFAVLMITQKKMSIYRD